MVSKQLSILVSVPALIVTLFVGPVAAQHHHGHGPTVVVGGGYYANPFWFGFGWYPYGYGPYWPYGYPYYGPYYGYEPTGALKLEVTPKDAEVYVDGFFAGIVDDFDGAFQRLRVLPGDHELTIFRDGLRTVHQRLYVSAGSTLKVKYAMEPLPPGEATEPRPTPPPPPDQPGPAGPPRGPAGRSLPPPPSPDQVPRSDTASPYGTVVIRVQPGGATIMIDGERWMGPEGEDHLVLQVSEGPHRIEIRKDGFESFATGVTIRRGETMPLNVSLRTR